MSDGPRGVVCTHGTLGEALIDSVQLIVGATGNLAAVSNVTCALPQIVARIQSALEGTERSAVIFVDLPGGSCFQAAKKVQRERPKTAIVTGVNLPMLLDFALGSQDAEHLGAHLRTVGVAGIKDSTS